MTQKLKISMLEAELLLVKTELLVANEKNNELNNEQNGKF